MFATETTIQKKVEAAYQRVSEAIKEFKPIAVFGLFSGGHDSFSSTWVASHHPEFLAAVHVNTGIGVEATRDYVRETCRERGWNFLERKAVENRNAKGDLDPQVYTEWVRKHGFPGPAGHRHMYSRLKQRCLEEFEREIGASARQRRFVLYVAGCRSQESERRMANAEDMAVRGRTVWVNPIIDWSKLDTSMLLELAEQPRNLVVDLIHKSGECLCGAFAKPGELEELNLWDVTRPVYLELKALEAEVSKVHPWGWGERPLRRRDPRQQVLCETSSLCWSCDKRA